ncbi:MAG: lysine 2,3-aminomutase [Magnetococcales bacterium]|nr:lysine 2,3-aminomutase [Magnetococcales bacterium]
MSYSLMHRSDLVDLQQLKTLPAGVLKQIETVSRVFPFRANAHILRLIDWQAVPDDPIFKMIFPEKDCVPPSIYQTLSRLDTVETISPSQKKDLLAELTISMNPDPSQQSQNIPLFAGEPLNGVQHKYQETVLAFPHAGQTCFAFCTYCFRWEQFIQGAQSKHKLAPHDIPRWIDYLKSQLQVTDVVLTGGDPLFMNASQLSDYLLPLLQSDLDHITNIRIGTKSLGFWPNRFLQDPDTPELLALFKQVVDRGKHLTLLANVNHPRELEPDEAREAIQVVRRLGVVIRTQSPLLAGINDQVATLKQLWESEIKLGCIPYYLFLPRDTGAKGRFEISIDKALHLVQQVYGQVSGLAKTVRAPVMSTQYGKVQVLGTRWLGGKKRFVFQYLQARDPHLTRMPFFARFDADATWFDQLEPAEAFDGFLFRGERPPEEG